MTTAAESSRKPAVVYPNSGESWDAVDAVVGRHRRPSVPSMPRSGWPRAPGWSAAAAGWDRRRSARWPGPRRAGRLARAGVAALSLRSSCVAAQCPAAQRDDRQHLGDHQAALDQTQRHGPAPRRPVIGRQQHAPTSGREPSQRQHGQPERDPRRTGWAAGPDLPDRAPPGQQQHRDRQAEEGDDAGHPVNLPVGARPDRPVVFGKQHITSSAADQSTPSTDPIDHADRVPGADQRGEDGQRTDRQGERRRG